MLVQRDFTTELKEKQTPLRNENICAKLEENSANPTDGSVQNDESFLYDVNGNRKYTGQSGNGIGKFNRITTDGTYWYEYDEEGNLRKRYKDLGAGNVGTLGTGDTDVSTYIYDHRDRLINVNHYADFASFSGNQTDKTVEYLYDAFNRRIGAKKT